LGLDIGGWPESRSPGATFNAVEVPGVRAGAGSPVRGVAVAHVSLEVAGRKPNVKRSGGQLKFCNMQPSVRGAADSIFGSEVDGSQHAVEMDDSRVRAMVCFAMS
jgi:hypothetical protein